MGQDPVVLDALIIYIHFRGIKIPPRKHGRKQDPNIWDVQSRIQQIQGKFHPTEAPILTMSVDIFEHQVPSPIMSVDIFEHKAVGAAVFLTHVVAQMVLACLLYTSPSPRDS